MTQHDRFSDEELVARFRDGDQAALRVLLGRLSARLEVRIRRRLSPGIRRKVAVSDVLQEANILAAERIADFEDRGEGSVARWFGKIVELKIREAVRHFAGTQRRDVAREVTRGHLPPGHDPAGNSPTPSEVAAGRQLKDAVRRKLESLPQDHRRVLRLLQQRGLTLDEAAAEMGRSREATRKLYARALLRLKELLEQEE